MNTSLRRLRLHGLIQRVPAPHCYRVTDHGLRVALFFTRSYGRLIRPGLGQIVSPLPADTNLQRATEDVVRAMVEFAKKLDSKKAQKG